VGVWPQWYYPGSFNKRINGKGRNDSTEYKKRYIYIYIYVCVCVCVCVCVFVYVQLVVW
jgi:hypothetical protein